MRRSTLSGGMSSLGLPPFTRAVKWIIISNFAIYFALLLANGLTPGVPSWIYGHLGLIPTDVVHGHLWQLVTYGFLHARFSHVLWNMFGIWMFGGQFETDWGRKKFLEYYFFCLIAAGITTVIVAYIGVALMVQSPATPLFRMLASLVFTPTVG